MNTLYYLGIPIKTKSFMFRDNRLVVDSSMTLHAKLCKKHIALSIHYIWEAIAAKIIRNCFILAETNPDILSEN